MAMLKKDYRKSTKRGMPKHWFDSHPHTHIALDDAMNRVRCSAICLLRISASPRVTRPVVLLDTWSIDRTHP
jgi:hypothetical protein